MAAQLTDIADALGTTSGRSRTVLEFTRTMKQVVDRAKQPDFTAASWAPLAEFVATDDFHRVGPFKDAYDWPTYVAFLTGWAPTSHWECSLRRITEVGNLVYLELEERMAPGDSANAANSASVYEFDDTGDIRRLDVYLQFPSPD